MFVNHVVFYDRVNISIAMKNLSSILLMNQIDLYPKVLYRPIKQTQLMYSINKCFSCSWLEFPHRQIERHHANLLLPRFRKPLTNQSRGRATLNSVIRFYRALPSPCPCHALTIDRYSQLGGLRSTRVSVFTDLVSLPNSPSLSLPPRVLPPRFPTRVFR